MSTRIWIGLDIHVYMRRLNEGIPNRFNLGDCSASKNHRRFWRNRSDPIFLKPLNTFVYELHFDWL